MMALEAQTVLVWGAVACALAGLILFALWFHNHWQQRQQAMRLSQVVDERLKGAPHMTQAPSQSRQTVEQIKMQAGSLGERWLKGRFGSSLLSEEDRVLIMNAGFKHIDVARQYFVLSRVGLSIVLIVLFSLLPMTRRLNEYVPFVSVFIGFALGWMLPKWWLARRVSQRRLRIAAELPLFVDLLRLLQGVGLSMDQTLHTIEREFHDVIPVMGSELTIAVEQYARGRTREQSLERIASGFTNEDLAVICRLIVQVDQHGGAMQEPLHRFGVRLREQRRLELKAKVGKLTVKMTGVMVLTLLPALLIITAGSGFLALFRGLSQVAGG